MSRLCRLKTKSHGDDGRWAYDEITRLRQQVATLTEQRDMAVEALRESAVSLWNYRAVSAAEKADEALAAIQSSEVKR